jgi:hypothetical protein
MRWLRAFGVGLAVTAAIGTAVAWASSRDSGFGWVISSYSAADGTLTTRHVCTEAGRFIISEGILHSSSAPRRPREVRWHQARSTSASAEWPLWGRTRYDTYVVLGFEASRADSGWHVAVPCWAVLVLTGAVTAWAIRRHRRASRGRGFALLPHGGTGR